MSTQKLTMYSLLAGLMLIVGAVLTTNDRGNQPSETEPTKQTQTSSESAPNFTLENFRGDTVSLSNISAPITVVNIWASWCPFCTKELPDFATLQSEFPEQIEVIAVNRGETRRAAKEFTDEAGITDELTFLLNPSESYYEKIGGFSMPETLFLDKNKTIFRHHRGPLSLEKMRKIATEKLNTISHQNRSSASSSLGCTGEECRLNNQNHGS